ncbi:MFS transporter [Actinobacteria bacterium YIM 96077]|uniref:MFS transporter n=1 Tax=Phytoactinopolyspora halophila TaxID=1981511 RepID=A0A329QDA2_9ACTN|nr:MFS transporter [Phytoactinopolyspora halophila]AYY14013.1 MFS transporter [Actinobacteria bacterium YIM 96077]RAW10264.1 MFS transporter [Phytoactinopolyspora halophila]
MSPITSYRRLLRLAGPAYVLIAFLGRLPLAMSQMGTLLLVADTSGSYAAGGLAAGTVAVANAVGAPVAGAIADRTGQRPVVLVQSLAASAGLTALVAASAASAPVPLVVVIAALAGVSIPQVGPLARVRWRPITEPAGEAQPRLVDAAFSYEGAADEASFVLGPALVGVLAASVNPGIALITAAALLAVFGSWFAAHPSAELTHTRRRAAEHRPSRLITPELVVLATAQLLIGMIFGATQTGTTVLATVEGNAGHAGLVHSLLGVGSVIAGLSLAAVPARIGYERRMVIAASALLVLSAPLLAVGSLAALIPVIVALGFAVAPYMISVFSLTERVVAPNRVAASLTLLAGATGIGYALGAAIAGRLADAGGHRPAFAVTVTAAAIALTLALTARRHLRTALARKHTEYAEYAEHAHRRARQHPEHTEHDHRRAR